MCIEKPLLVSIILFVGTSVFAQTTIPREAYHELFRSSMEHTRIYENYQFAKPHTIGEFFHVLYKKNFSFFDTNNCNFSPTCSTYGLATIKKHGFFIGIIDTFDRLTRCHAKAELSNYEHDATSHLFIDYP